MNADNQANWPNSLIAIIGGAAATLIAALITFPLMQATAEPYFELNFGVKDPGMSANDIIFLLIVTLWLALAALAGGLVTALICRSFHYRHAGVLIFLSLIFYGYIFSDSPRKGELIYIFLMLLCTTGGFLAGTSIGKRISLKRKTKNQMPG
ncbi:MAG: hypothetical protein IPP73_07735 [Chitinophagaceae bacterium]|nr:hypothetical protein [Chitinophagaceae bacterium]